MSDIKRREFITLLGGAAAWPLAARAQQGERVRRVGVLMNTTSDEPDSQARVTALAQGLQEAGWAVGCNLRIDAGAEVAADDVAITAKTHKELARARRRNALRSFRRSGEPAWVIASSNACDGLGPDLRRALGPAAIRAAPTGRTHDRTRPTLLQRQKALANQAPSTHDP